MCVVGKSRQPHFKLRLEHWVMVPSLRQRTATATATRPHFHSTVESLYVLLSFVKTLDSNESSLTINNFVARHPRKSGARAARISAPATQVWHGLKKQTRHSSTY